ncbi:hypothetical protein SAMN05216298_0456 [Glycomyces sambucus]|uniref:Uncharacterized protein n=1 Tax=Glycomyces sambucus TaxID=380244 RepID=A0A1G9CPZ0_9ACTN|nr:hypothetical protein [Glycomyces sambucus]SDK53760.1 hypothetical protein SAMN05216298_0456 [Glycomyces sambucus]
MTTALDTRAPLLRRRPEALGGPLAAVLLAVALLLTGSPVAMIPYLLAMAVAIATAMISGSAVVRTLSWLVFLAAWIAGLVVYLDHAMQADRTGWTVPLAESLVWVWLATPAVLFLLVCWKSPRPRFDTVLIEVILLLIIGTLLGAKTPGYIEGAPEPGTVPVEAILIHLGAAAYFGFAAWLVPTRRIFYGSVALTGIVIAAAVLFTGDRLTNHTLFPALALGIPLIGLLLQITEWLRRRSRPGRGRT